VAHERAELRCPWERVDRVENIVAMPIWALHGAGVKDGESGWHGFCTFLRKLS
jgi:hypothetical protein